MKHFSPNNLCLNLAKPESHTMDNRMTLLYKVPLSPIWKRNSSNISRQLAWHKPVVPEPFWLKLHSLMTDKKCAPTKEVWHTFIYYQEIKEQLRMICWTRYHCQKAVRKSLIDEVCLPDGRWPMKKPNTSTLIILSHESPTCVSNSSHLVYSKG